MMPDAARDGVLPDILRHSPVNVTSGEGCLARLGELAAGEGIRHALLVTDRAIRAAGHVDRAVHHLHREFVHVTIFDDAEPNPTTDCVNRGVAMARSRHAHGPIDGLVGLGGGSAMDCAKGINLILCNGGEMATYRGDPPAEALARRKPLLPMILAPTTAGTGSEAQSFALISDAATHAKMACGDRRLPTAGGLRPRWAILDSQLTWTMPPRVAAATGIDALTHAVETAGSSARTDVSRSLSREAWRLLRSNFAKSVRHADDGQARAAMLLGAHLAGAAIENSMLGAAHACANPLTTHFNVTHGVAVGLMLPHVIRHNCENGDNPYSDVCESPDDLSREIHGFLDAAGLPKSLRELNVPKESLEMLAADAATQWTARFNPRPVEQSDLLRLYQSAFER